MSVAVRSNRVLCVDDDPDTCALVKAALPRFDIECADSISAATELLGSSQFALVILDQHLINGKGLELCQKIRERDYLTPIIVISCDEDITTTEVKIAGGQYFISKSSPQFIDQLRLAADRFAISGA